MRSSLLSGPGHEWDPFPSLHGQRTLHPLSSTLPPLVAGGEPAGPLVQQRREHVGVLQTEFHSGILQNSPKVARQSPAPCSGLVLLIPAPGPAPWLCSTIAHLCHQTGSLH